MQDDIRLKNYSISNAVVVVILSIFLIRKSQQLVSGLLESGLSYTELLVAILSQELYFLIAWATVFSISLFLLYRLINKRQFALEFREETKYQEDIFHQKVEDLIIEKGILPKLRLEINHKLKLKALQDSIRLPDITIRGLAEVYHSIYEIPTNDIYRLDRLIKIMPGGSIGISGPRGVGKSTILWSFCKGNKNAKGKKVISLLTSAPVNYDPREFILHIFSSLCIKILDETETKFPYSNEYMDSAFNIYGHSLWGSLFRKNIKRLITLLFITSVFLVIFSIYIASVIYNTPNKVTFIEALGISPAASLSLGTILLILGIILYALDSESAKNKRSYESKFLSKKYEDDPRLKGIISDVIHELRRIRYLENLSTSTKSSLKLPTLIEGGVDAHISLSEIQSSLPEIIERYKNVIGNASEKYIFFIGIDELDKLQSDEQAHNFLNGIKAIFGLDNVFYLISVSENAMSNFERRGLPFRDTFDSAFDKVIQIDYLDLIKSKELIDQRVIGIPLPFLCFCYVLSGGLPRDLIRICREMLEQFEKDSTKNDLSAICNTIIINDLKSKIKAMTYEAKKYPNEMHAGEFLSNIHKLNSFLSKCTNITAINREIEDIVYYFDYVIISSNNINSLREELAVYYQYCITLIEFFFDEKDNPKKYNLEFTLPFDELANIRQNLEVSPVIARELMRGFHETYGDYLKYND